MKTKNKKRVFFLLFATFFTVANFSFAQIVGANAYMKGNNIEIGISGIGGFEGAPLDSTSVPFGMHFRSNNPFFGFVANPQLNSWATFDGDFFTPGSPENGWGFEIDSVLGTSQGNNCAYLQQIDGAITNWSYSMPQTDCDWEGDATTATDLHFKINYQLQDNDLFYITTVTVTNNTTLTIPQLYYYRNLDPDNNIVLSSDYTTNNTILGQPACCTYANVSATQALPWNSFFAFLTEADTNWRASVGGFSNRDASDLWNGVGFNQTVGTSSFMDEAIAISYRIQNLIPGGSETFKFCTMFAGDSVTLASAISRMEPLVTSLIDLSVVQNLITVYPNPFNENATITIDKTVQLKNAEMHLYNVLGEEIINMNNIQSHELKIQKNSISEGVYFYKMINNAMVIGTGKLIIK